MHIRRHQQPSTWPDATRGSPTPLAPSNGQYHRRWAWHHECAQVVQWCVVVFADINSSTSDFVEHMRHMWPHAVHNGCVHPSAVFNVAASVNDTCLHACYELYKEHSGEVASGPQGSILNEYAPIVAHHFGYMVKAFVCTGYVHNALIQTLLTLHLLVPVQLCRAWQSSMQRCPCCLAHTDRRHHPPPWVRKWPMLLTGLLGRGSRYHCPASPLTSYPYQLCKRFAVALFYMQIDK